MTGGRWLCQVGGPSSYSPITRSERVANVQSATHRVQNAKSQPAFRPNFRKGFGTGHVKKAISRWRRLLMFVIWLIRTPKRRRPPDLAGSCQSCLRKRGAVGGGKACRDSSDGYCERDDSPGQAPQVWIVSRRLMRDQNVRSDNLDTASTGSRIFGAVVDGGGDAIFWTLAIKRAGAAAAQALMKQVVPSRA